MELVEKNQVNGTRLDTIRLEACGTSYYDEFLGIGFDPPSEFFGPVDSESDACFAAMFEDFANPNTLILVEVWPATNLEAALDITIEARQAGGWQGLDLDQLTSSNDRSAYLLSWVLPASDPSLQDAYLIESATWSRCGAVYVSALYYEEDFSLLSGPLEESVRSICAD